MKNKLYVIALILLTPILILNFYYPSKNTQSPPQAPLPYTDKFLIGAMNSQENMPVYDSGGFNTTHKYIESEWNTALGRHTPIAYMTGEHLFDPVPTQAIRDILTDIYNNHNQSRFIWQRPKIEWLSFGQSSIYKAFQDDPDYWFYGFNDTSGTRFTDIQWNGGKDVLYCSSVNMGPGAHFVLKRLKANTEQCKRIVSGKGNEWSGDTECDWFVKPKIRANRNFIINPNNSEVDICKIYVVLNDGTTQKLVTPTTIKAKHFQKNYEQGNLYNGGYLEEFYFDGPLLPPRGLKFHGDLIRPDNTGQSWYFSARGENPETAEINHADIQIEWLDNCEMWIDYVKVENDIADELFKGIRDPWITDEANAVMIDPIYVYNFYTELTEFNNIPCMAYINHKLDSITGGRINYMSDLLPYYQYHMPWYAKGTIDTPDKIKKFFFDRTGIKQIYLGDPYPITATHDNGCFGYTIPQYSKIPNTLPAAPNQYEEYGDRVAPAVYDAWLQNQLDTACAWYTSGGSFNEVDNGMKPMVYKGSFKYLLKRGSAMSKLQNIPFVMMLQAHQWVDEGELDREPTIEEQDLMVNVTVSYGAKGIIFWQMPSFYTNNPCFYCKGIDSGYGNPRRNNVYNQPKWDSLKSTVARLKKWGPTLMSFDNRETDSYIYRVDNERIECINETYFRDVVSYKTGTGEPPCSEDSPDTTDAPHPNGLRYECNEDRYLQVATFKGDGSDYNKYFMIVNRRCSPYKDESNEDNRGGKRFMRVYFDQNHIEFAGYNSWNIIDVENPRAIVGKFDKTALVPYVDLDWFNPGQGKLYKIVPVLPTGGILAGNENITGQNFTCEAPVYNNGYNITIGANTTIHFNDSSKFVMSGGVFTVGDQNTSAPQNITSDAVPGGSWRGHSFTNCEVKIYGATFTGLANDTTYAVNIIDCPVVDIRNCTFNTNSSLKGGVNAICFNNPFIAINNIYIGSNTFNSSGSTIPTVNVSSYAGVTTPLIIENNTFNEGNTAVFLSGVIGGAIKGNTMTDNYIGINALTSSIDVVQNNISSTVTGSMGIFAAGGSELKLNSSGAFTLGGLNNILNEGTGTNNINVDGSYFLLDDGENIFNISSDQNSYHLYGYFPMFTAVTTEETNNCFKVDGSPVDPPINMVTSGYQGSQITFNFNPYLAGCEIPDGGDGLAIDLGDGIYDTIYTGGSGSGGSHSSVASVRRTDKQVYVDPAAKTMYDSISVLMRYRNYTQAKTKCLDLINTYPDSIQSIFAVSKLFLATVASDTSYNAANTLKIFYENLILNHPGNTSLVKRANYYILKCKVRMHEYSQALAGFQQIINQSPYSYEGLIARWDYMATSLLIQGQGGGYSSIDNNSDEFEVGQRHAFDYSDIDGNDDDKKPFTKEQRQDIRKSINTAIEISKNDDEVKIKTLEEKSELGDVNASKELTQMKSLKQVVKTEKPKSIIEHVRIVSEDIRKVFGSSTSSKGNEPKNIPLVFRISQNYPNPFNPVTKINYDLPKDSKVNIVIYDILGREVKRLVNNELKTAGSYIVDFNAMNYASGVYFYRIEAEEPNGNKFVDSKKMVLLK
ncbi:MAG: T9SS type A sorting domain-containing protein [Ignavibacteria bacterium]|nr:T9SS type A sorting domain-containing protein [Ignavibacteria bacterium]